MSNKYIDLIDALQELIKMADKKPKIINKLVFLGWGFVATFGTAAVISAIATLIKILR
jgi:hypothetical protein